MPTALASWMFLKPEKLDTFFLHSEFATTFGFPGNCVLMAQKAKIVYVTENSKPPRLRLGLRQLHAHLCGAAFRKPFHLPRRSSDAGGWSKMHEIPAQKLKPG
jgi:hypothetical protein